VKKRKRVRRFDEARFIVVFDGPARHADTGRSVVRIMAEDDCEATVFPSVEAARGLLAGHLMREYARWILDVDTGETHDPY
jgi:hypothetical protein